MPIQFGWSDTLYAIGTCVSCRVGASSSTDSLNNYAQNTSNPRVANWNRMGSSHSSLSLPEGLRPLLMNDSTDDEYGDSLSLHSNVGGSGGKTNMSRTRGPRPGSAALSETETERENVATASFSDRSPRTRSKKRGKRKARDRRSDGWFTFLGYDLFGKKKPPIQLPLTDEEEEEEEEAERRRRRVRKLSGDGSGTTLDSDAAPLDDAAIAAAVRKAHTVADINSIEPTNKVVGGYSATAPAGDEEVAKHIEEEERQRNRRERKERKALERALNSGFSSLKSFNTSEGEFEGFQGSGDGASLIALKSSPSESTSFSSKRQADGTDEEDEVVDFDGQTYARPVQTVVGLPKPSGSRTMSTRSSNSVSASSGRRTDRRSHYRARSNVSSNEAADEFHEAMFNTSASVEPRQADPRDTEDLKKKKSKKTRSKPSPLASSSTATSSQSPSLPSPPGSAALGPGLSMSLSMPPSSPQTYLNVTGATMPTKNTSTKPTMVPGLGLENQFLTAPGEPLSVYDLDGLDNSNRGFPSVGFGRRNSTLSNGAFLARRED